MKSFLRTSVLAVLLVAFSIDATAQQRQRADRPRVDRQEKMQKMKQHRTMMKTLNLSDEQREKFQEIHLNGQKGMLPLRTQMQEKRAELRTLTVNDNYDEDAVSELISEISDLHAAMLTMQISHRQQMREILTEEQRIKFDSMQLRKANNRGARMMGNFKR